MRVVNKKEFAKYPNGTVFQTFDNGRFTGELSIKTGQYVDNTGWNGELSIQPFLNCEDSNKAYFTQWCTIDNSSHDYGSNELFAVFSKTEVKKMIDCLQWALSDCKSYFNEDCWYFDDTQPLSDCEVGLN